MAEIVPFRGILYNTSKVKGEDVVAPPYDIITPEFKEDLYKKSPFNIVRIDFGKELKGDTESDNKYTRAARNFSSWMEKGIFSKREVPAFYAHEVDYEIKGRRKRLRGFLCLVKIEELGKGVYPHECTHSKPKADRLNLMRACNANISPIFSLYNSPERKASEIINMVIDKGQPYMEAKDIDGAAHRLWIIDNENDVEIIRNDLKGKAVFIADGHHRYETALEFQREMNSAQLSAVSSQTPPQPPLSKGGIEGGVNPWDYALMFLANIADGDLTIFPAHRLVRDLPENPLDMLSEYFEIEALSLDSNIQEVISMSEHSIGFYRHGGEKRYILRHKGSGLDDLHPALRGLDVSALHELIFKRLLKVTDITYEMDTEDTMDKVRKGLYEAAFFLNPTRVGDVERVALSGVRMPPKSTYFYPKLLTGMVIYKF